MITVALARAAEIRVELCLKHRQKHRNTAGEFDSQALKLDSQE